MNHNEFENKIGKVFPYSLILDPITIRLAMSKLLMLKKPFAFYNDPDDRFMVLRLTKDGFDLLDNITRSDADLSTLVYRQNQ